MINSDGFRVPVYGTPREWLAWLLDPDEDRAHEATLILGGLEPDDEVDPHPLVAALTSDRFTYVFWATVALGRLGHRAAAALPRLCEIALSHHAFGVRQAALMAIVKIAPGNPRVKETITRALRDANAFVRGQALQAMIQVPEVSAEELEWLTSFQTDPDAGVAFWAEVAVRNIRLR